MIYTSDKQIQKETSTKMYTPFLIPTSPGAFTIVLKVCTSFDGKNF